LPVLGAALLRTFQLALVGTIIGVILSLPLATFAANGITQGFLGKRVLYPASRLLIASFHTVLDFVWALIFVITVGLGPFAGAFAIVVNASGFAAGSSPRRWRMSTRARAKR
jgi:phosphonate transport system permease protein